MPTNFATQIAALILTTFSLVNAGCAQSQPAPKPFEPYSGQPGKDVVWVPTSQALVDKMLNIARVTASDHVIDLGSGDGRTVITAAKRGARALGIEYNPEMVELSKQNALKAGVAGKAEFIKADLYETDLSQATVITMFLLPEINLKLRPKILDLKPGTRIVSNTFTMGDWVSDESATADDKDGCSYYCRALMWIVPAKVEGTWRTAQGGDLVINQSFQNFAGSLRVSGKSLSFTNGRLRGDQITFSVGGADYSGKVSGNTMEGTVKGSATGAWSATRAGKS